MSIAENIKTLREKAGFQQSELAGKVGVSQAIICKIENGLKTPSLALGRLLAKELNCTLDDLVQ